MTDPYAEWDGAYVMGALSSGERQEYEQHLATCTDCSRALAELGPLPGLLGRLDPAEAELLLEPAGAAPTSVTRPRVVPVPVWRRAPMRLGAAVAAAVIAVAIAVPVVVHHGRGPDETVTLAPAGTRPLSATVTLTRTAWGTEVETTCLYAGYPGPARGYALYVVDPAGRAMLVSSWRAAPGQTARTTGSTELPIGDIARVELRAQGGAVLLSSRA